MRSGCKCLASNAEAVYVRLLVQEVVDHIFNGSLCNLGKSTLFVWIHLLGGRVS